MSALPAVSMWICSICMGWMDGGMDGWMDVKAGQPNPDLGVPSKDSFRATLEALYPKP